MYLRRRSCFSFTHEPTSSNGKPSSSNMCQRSYQNVPIMFYVNERPKSTGFIGLYRELVHEDDKADVTGGATIFLTWVPFLDTLTTISLVKDSRDTIMRVLLMVERERCPRAERHTPFPGGSGSPTDRHYDRSPRCSVDSRLAAMGNTRRSLVSGSAGLELSQCWLRLAWRVPRWGAERRARSDERAPAAMRAMVGAPFGAPLPSLFARLFSVP